MLALKIISTVFLGLSVFTCVGKNLCMFDRDNTGRNFYLWTIYSWLWRALVIVTIWVI